ncbi:hypothetical protein WAI453_012062 [Rhynchosporium graminicola]
MRIHAGCGRGGGERGVIDADAASLFNAGEGGKGGLASTEVSRYLVSSSSLDIICPLPHQNPQQQAASTFLGKPKTLAELDILTQYAVTNLLIPEGALPDSRDTRGGALMIGRTSIPQIIIRTTLLQ